MIPPRLLLVPILLLAFSPGLKAAPTDLFGQDGWALITPNATDASLSKSADPGNPDLAVTITKPSQPFYLIQIVRGIPVSVAAEHIVQMHFLARSTTSNTIRASIEQTSAPYTAVTDKTITLTPAWQTYTLEGDSVDFVPTGINAHLQVGQQAGTVEFKDITVEDLGIDPTIAAAQSALQSDKIQARIEKYRKGNLKITVVDREGHPVKNALVTITQTRHAFLFGCNVFGYDPKDTSDAQKAYRNQFAALFNYATLPFYWGAFENKQGAPDYDRLQSMADWCIAHGITPKGHPLVWQQVWPNWAPTNPDAAKPLLQARVHDLITHYAKSIHYWDVVNEANSSAAYSPPNGESLWVKRDGPASVVETALDWARTAGSGNQETFLYNDFDTTQKNVALLTQLQKDGQLPDAIGLQSHMHQGPWPLTKVWTVCQTFAQFGKPIHFTETTVLSGTVDQTTGNLVFSPTTPEGEAAQADYVTKFYTILFSHPDVQAITWWDFSDHNSWMNAPAGLLRSDMTPKPVYTQLLNLIHKVWWTNASARTDIKGTVKQRVFYGAYTLNATDAKGHTVHKDVFFPEASSDLSVTLKINNSDR